MSTLLSLSHWDHQLLALFKKVHEFVQNSVVSPRSARLNIFALGAPIFSDFQQRASVCPEQRFQPQISTIPHFRTGCTNFKHVLVSARVCTKPRFQPMTSMSFLHWVQHVLAVFTNVHEFV